MQTVERHISSKGLLNKIIENLMEERLGNAYQKNQEKHDKWMKDSICLSNGIIGILGSERNLFDRYEELSTTRESTFLRDAYIQGFDDGVELLVSLLYGKESRLLL